MIHNDSIFHITSPHDERAKDVKIQFEWTPCDEVSEDRLDQCYKLVLRLRKMYMQSGMGWNSRAKKKEMRQPQMQYLFAVPEHEPNAIAGFASIMFECSTDLVESDKENDDVDKNRAAISMDRDNASQITDQAYLYELHVDNAYQGCGLGKSLLSKLIDKCKLSTFSVSETPTPFKICLTVFSANSTALKLYSTFGFHVAKTSSGSLCIYNENTSDSDSDNESNNVNDKSDKIGDDQGTLERTTQRRRITRSGKSVDISTTTPSNLRALALFTRGWRELELRL